MRIHHEALWVTPIAEAEYVPWLSNSGIGIAQVW